MQIRQLKHLVALAETGSFGRAAEAVHLSQPALSRSIDSLEANLGACLVERGYGSIKLTAAGEMVLARATRLLQDADEIRRDMRRLHDLELGELNVGLGAFAAATIGQTALARLIADYPQLRTRIEVNDSASLRDKLDRRLLDVLIVDTRNLEHDPGLHIERLPDVPVGFFVAQGHHLLTKAQPTLVDLLDYPVAAPHLPERVRDYFAELLQSDRRALFSIACNDIATLRRLALQSQTVILAPMVNYQDELTESMVRVDIQTLDAMTTRYSLVRQRSRGATPAALAFEETVRSLLQ